MFDRTIVISIIIKEVLVFVWKNNRFRKKYRV